MSEEFEKWKLSHEYSWNWFQYHAGQRMIVFRFYLIFIGIIAAGSAKIYSDGFYVAAALMSLLVTIFSILFWRLDLRSADLIKIAERHLTSSEIYLSSVSGSTIEFTRHADEKRNEFASKHATSFLFSFREIFSIIFCIVGLSSIVFSSFIIINKLFFVEVVNS